MLVSVIIPCFNQGRFLPESVGSVLSQTYSAVECLVVDDGSTDDTSRIAAALAARHPHQVRLLKHPGNERRGLAASRNLGIESATGTFIATLDADDAWLPSKLDRQMAVLERYPEVGLVYGKVALVRQEHPDRRMNEHDWSSCQVSGGSGSVVSCAPFDATPVLLFDPPQGLTNWVPSPTPVVRRETLGTLRFHQGPVCRRLGVHFEDYLLWLQLSLRCPFYAIDDVLALYRLHPDQASAAFIRRRDPLRLLAGTAEILRDLQESCSDRLPPDVTPARLRRRLGDSVIKAVDRTRVTRWPRLAAWAVYCHATHRFTTAMILTLRQRFRRSR